VSNQLNIGILRQLCNSGQIKWTAHILERMQERDIHPSDVINCIQSGEIIEQYPNAFPYPACLILGTKTNNIYIHVVAGYGDGFVWIVTAYEPEENEWANGFKHRKG